MSLLAIQEPTPVTLVMGLSTFTLICALWAIALLAWMRMRSSRSALIRRRLGIHEVISAPARTLRLWYQGDVATTVVEDGNSPMRLRERMLQARRKAGWEGSWQRILLPWMAAVVPAGFLGFALTGRVVPALMTAAMVPLAFRWYLGRRIRKREALFESHLVDALELCARALRAGHPLTNSFQLIADEIPDPVGPMFGEMCKEQDLGVPLETSIRRAARLSGSADMKLFAASLTINMRSGGSLADVVEDLAKVIRERMKLSRRFRVLIAQTQFSKKVLVFLPVAMFGLLNVLNPEYMETLYVTRAGHLTLLGGTVLLLGGWWTMNKMASVTA